MKKCNTCEQSQPKNNFIGSRGQETTTCQTCMDRNKIADSKRTGRKRDWKKELDNNPERKQKKEEWKLQNHEKVSKYTMDYRMRLIEKDGMDKYHKKYAIQAKKWREENKEYVKEYSKKFNQLATTKLENYKSKALYDGKKWELSDNYALELIMGNCYYCDSKCEENESNGIDRLDCLKDYILENSVSSCTICNYIKICLDPITFINRCKNILINKKIINDKADYSIYPESKEKSYSNYKKSAEQRSIEFKLTIGQFNKLIKQNCNYCGITNNDLNNNGIDRIKNEEGYTLENSITSCSSCNYMKNDYGHDEFIEQVKKIYNHSKQYLDKMIYEENFDEETMNKEEYKIFPKQLNNIIKSSRMKMTKEEKDKLKLEKQPEKNEILIHHLFDEDYKNQKAQELKEKYIND